MNREPLRNIAADRGLVGGPFGSSLVNADYTDEGIPVIRGANMSAGRFIGGQFAFVSQEKFARDLSRNSAAPRDVIYTQRGTLGQVALVPSTGAGTFVVSQSQMRLRVDPQRAVPEFVYYACTTSEFLQQVDDRAISTGVPHTNLGILAELEIPLPSLSEQQAIAEVLGALDDKIAANTALASTTESTIAVAYAAATHDGVVERPLLDELVIEFGEPFGGAQFSEPGVGRPLIRIRDLKTFKSQVWSTEFRPKEVVVAAGDVVVGMDAEFRATPWLGGAGLLNQRVLRARHATFGRALVREMLRRPLAEIEGEKSATTVIHLNKADLARKTVDVPDADSITAFERVAEPLYEVRVALAAENRTLAATRDALLPQLMSGKLRVRDAEEMSAQAGV